MKEYKTVAGPVGLTITKKESYVNAVSIYADIIQRECVGGWELMFIQEIPVTKKAGCIAGLMGSGDITVTFNMLVFVRGE